MKAQKTVIALLILAAGSVSAEPIYLSCIASSTKETHSFSVAIDESTRKITHQGKSGNAFNAEGFFTMDEIAYKKVGCASSICVTHQYAVNRIDLSVEYLFRVEPVRKDIGVAASEILSTGSCEIIEAPERKI